MDSSMPKIVSGWPCSLRRQGIYIHVTVHSGAETNLATISHDNNQSSRSDQVDLRLESALGSS